MMKILSPVVYSYKIGMQKYSGKDSVGLQYCSESKKMRHFTSPDCVTRTNYYATMLFELQHIFKSLE